jgi:phosphonate transport system substrate-binding protein
MGQEAVLGDLARRKPNDVAEAGQSPHPAHDAERNPEQCADTVSSRASAVPQAIDGGHDPGDNLPASPPAPRSGAGAPTQNPEEGAKMRLSWALTLSFVLCAAVGAAPAAQPSGAVALSFGVVPQQSASKLARTWNPLLEYLKQRTGVGFTFRTAPSIPEFERRVSAGAYDMAYMNPYHYTVFSESPGYLAFAKARDKQIKGIIVVRADSPIQSIHDLGGKTLAFPAPAAFAASILTRSYLAEQEVAFNPKYVSSHDSVYRTVAKGLYTAGGGVKRTFAATAPEIRAQLRILWTTKGYTPHAIAAHPRVPPEVVERIAGALFEMDGGPEGRTHLDSLKVKGFEAATDSDWDDVRALRIDLLEELMNPPR